MTLEIIKRASEWSRPAHLGWWGGHWWWVALTAGAGLVVSALRRVTRLPPEVPGLFDDLRVERIDTSDLVGVVAVSMVSLVGGASVGPEKVLGAMGAGAGNWVGRRRRLDPEDAAVTALSGVAGMFGGLFSSPVIVSLMILEVARPGGRRFSKTLVTNLVAGSISFGIYFAIAGAVFLGAYPVPHFSFADWQLLAAVPLGLFASLVTLTLRGLNAGAARAFDSLRAPGELKAVLGGVLFGVVGVALPLTVFSGGDQLASLLEGARTLGLAVTLSVLVAKMATYAISQASGFVGGPIFPTLFIGGAAGVVAHQVVPAISLGLAFSCLLPAVLGSIAAAPFSMVLMAAFLTRVGELQTAPILIAVVSAYLGVEGATYLRERRDRPREGQPESEP